MGIENRRKDLKYSIAILFVFSVFFVIKKAFFADVFYAIEEVVNLYPISYFVAYGLVGLPVVLFVFFTNEKKILDPFRIIGSF